MNALAYDQKVRIIHMLVEGNSIRSIERLTGAHRDTIMRLLVKVGNQCRDFLDRTLRNLALDHNQCDEIWTFVGKKQGRVRVTESDKGIGDQYLFVAIDEEIKLIATFAVGKRTTDMCQLFLDDLASRVHHSADNWPKVSTDGFRPYRYGVRQIFGGYVRHGVLIKDYRNAEQPGRYGPPEMVHAERIPITGDLDPFEICTSHLERNNLTIRTFMRRFTRLTLGFSKKLDNLVAAVALHVAHFNFCRTHGAHDRKRTPAMAAGLTGHPWTLEELLREVIEN